MKSTQIRLASRPVAEPLDSDFEVATAELPEPEEGQVVLRTLHLSLDPYMRGRMSDAPSYAAPVGIGEVMVGQTVSEVVASRSERREVGDIVLAYTGWQSHAVVDARATRRLDPSAAPVSTALGVLGMPGFTAYGGLLAIGQPKAGETVVVAAAAGPVGSAVGQIAKAKGARAVGIAGGPEKCRLLLDEYGFDAAVDHRSPTLREDLAAATPDGIDVYFENVGGHVAAEVVRRFNTYARMPVCGLIAGYNGGEPMADFDRLPGFMRRVLTKSLTVRGFIQDEFVPTHWADFQREMSGWVADGTVRYREDVVDSLENAPEAFRGLLAGRNVGKLLVKVADPAGV
ncbi:NADP-dependent oxidoreductase [Nocardioides sp.]|uniref:NADP-dependent oxidoreductase n=1 Tax=Nocardioides sp. TaxID=35761 RepID=UPI002C135270|nr:NADP-dependent oxidoreductase [Nocardioides sp.]HSX67764.1 NADP-dependent oxidoreductase [Nocardioides sp.]